MLIHIEQHDIDNGEKMSCSSCPGALAINRVLVSDYTCKVTKCYITILTFTDHCVYYLQLPTELSRFIFNYDRGRTVEPISFELSLPKYFVKWSSMFKEEFSG